MSQTKLLPPANEIINGSLLLINKPLGWTSFDVVNKIRWIIKKQLKAECKVGHAGTLDPLATGLMLLCTGKKTKEIEQITGLDKRYTGTFYIGATTPCFDLELEPDTFFPTDHISESALAEAVKHFMGKQQQMPPIFSAKKVEGKRAYELARKGKSIDVKPKDIEIKQFALTRIDLPELDFDVTVTSGTYIRSLAYDFGKYLNSGAYLKSLCRTEIGPYNLNDAFTIEDFKF
jgi:tRNA pseudouridine55 synthase